MALLASSGKVHPISQAGFGGEKSELYDKFRASYAYKVLSHIRKAVSRKEYLRIVEVGCGTGIFTRALLAHPEWDSSVSEIRCIDPNEGMRAVFAKTVKDSRVSLFDGTFENTEVPDGWADLIVSASAFHWCPEHENAINEFIRILKPEGTMSFLWNMQDKENFAWVQQLDDICTPYHYGSIDIWEVEFNKWRRIFDLPLYKINFIKPGETTVFSVEHSTLESVILHAFTRSGVAILPDEEKRKVREKIKAVVLRGDDLRWVDEKQGMFEVPYATTVVIMQRKPL
ncbi:hypothetical protein M0805_001768 [Coniferiporia weirii]|nr:hypothetical protein M0805_001768 [Coniferiporia weirii]